MKKSLIAACVLAFCSSAFADDIEILDFSTALEATASERVVKMSTTREITVPAGMSVALESVNMEGQFSLLRPAHIQAGATAMLSYTIMTDDGLETVNVPGVKVTLNEEGIEGKDSFSRTGKQMKFFTPCSTQDQVFTLTLSGVARLDRYTPVGTKIPYSLKGATLNLDTAHVKLIERACN